MERDLSTFASQEEYGQAVDAALAAARAYLEGELLMDDATYDALLRRITATEAGQPSWRRSDSPVGVVSAGVAATGTVKHSAPMLSLKNVFSREELVDWAAGLVRRLTRPVDGGYLVECKFDGNAVNVRYENGRLVRITQRGDGKSGEDITFAASRIAGLPMQLAEPVTFDVRGEVFFTNDDYQAASELRVKSGKAAYANPRNAAAGYLRKSKPEYEARLTFFAYGYVGLEGATYMEALQELDRLGIATTLAHSYRTVRVATIEEAADRIEWLEKARPNLPFAIDGAVIKVDSTADRDLAGNGSDHPHWAVAYKYPADTAITILEDVDIQVGRTGRISFRAVLKPVPVGGTTISSATLHNADYILGRGFLKGDPVTVYRAGEVIPCVEASVPGLRKGTEQPIVLPDDCPRCGTPLDKSAVMWLCPRGRECGAAEWLLYAVSRAVLDIKGIGKRVVNELVEKKLALDPADLFMLTREKLLTLDTLAAGNVEKVLEQIEAARKHPLERIVAALGMVKSGTRLSTRLAEHFGSLDAIVAADVESLMQVEGVGVDKAGTYVEELQDLAPVIEKFRTVGVTLEQPQADTSGKNLLEGKSVVVTGTMSGTLAGYDRIRMGELIKRAGGREGSSVTAKTWLLVAGDGQSGSSKYKKAEGLGIRIVGPEEFAEMVADVL